MKVVRMRESKKRGVGMGVGVINWRKREKTEIKNKIDFKRRRGKTRKTKENKW